MAVQPEYLVGAQTATAGESRRPRLGLSCDQMVSDFMPRYYQLAYDGRLWTYGMTLTSISNATYSFTSTTDATLTSIIGLWNPTTSGVNVIPLIAYCGIAITAATNTGTGPLVWTISTGNSAITTGSAPLNTKSLTTLGSTVNSVTKCFAGNVAFTGKTTANTIFRASSLGVGSMASFSFVGTAVGQATSAAPIAEVLDGSVIIPPGGVLALQTTATAVAHSAASGILFTELPV